MRGSCKKSSILVVLVFSVLCRQTHAAQIKDAESATHGYDAAKYQITDTYVFPGFELIQVNLPVLSHYSYLVVSDAKTLIVDPGRDIEFYLDLIKKRSLSVVGIFLTHSHADFVAGHMEMVKAVNCPIYQSAKSNAKYKIEPVGEGTTIEVGRAKVRFIDTPGHVIDGTSAEVYGIGKKTPELILTGDYLFVGGVGRPDLVESTTSSALAGMLFDTWNNTVSKLPDEVKVFPAHGAGSLCGAHLKDQPSSTIGEERTSNPYLQHTNRAEFITSVLSELQEPPQYFKYNAAMNRDGPPIVDWQQPVQPVVADASLSDSSRYYVADIRDSKDFAAGHIPNSVNIGIRGRFETWVGIMVPWNSQLVLAGEETDLAEAVHRLHRVGYQAMVVPVTQWYSANLPVLKNTLIAPKTLYEQMQSGQSPMILDVRLPNEWMGLRIGTVLNLPLNHLAELSAKLDPAQPVVAVCNSAYRSSMAIGILERKNFNNVTSLEGGSEAWIEAGLPVYSSQTLGLAQAPSKKMIPLPERICQAELKRLMMDLPGTFELVDIRPPQMFSDYSLPGSRNVDMAELTNNPAYLIGTGPLIIVDRDGTLAMAVGGILAQKTQRQIKVLFGGLEAYWQESSFGPPISIPSMGTPTIAPGQTPTLPPVPSTVTPAVKKKSAGC